MKNAFVFTRYTNKYLDCDIRLKSQSNIVGMSIKMKKNKEDNVIPIIPVGWQPYAMIWYIGIFCLQDYRNKRSIIKENKRKIECKWKARKRLYANGVWL